jgi:hypothetical protein
MGRITEILRQNKLYVVLLVFILGINLLSFVGWFSGKIAPGTGAVVQEEQVRGEESRPVRRLFDEGEQKVRREKMEALLKKSPSLAIFLGLVNLMILFVIFAGLILDAYFFTRWLRKEPIRLRDLKQDDPRWGMADIVRVILIFMACGYIVAILQLYGVKYFPIFRNSNFRMISNTALMNVIGISVILYFVVKKYGQKIKVIGLTFKKAGPSIFYGAVGYVALVPVLLGIMVITFFVAKRYGYHPPMQPIVQVFIEEKTTLVLWLSALFAAVFGPVAEEIFFRGFMYTAVRKKLGIFRGILITSVIFSFLHAHAIGFLPIVALGFLLAYVYEKTGSLVAPIAVHILHNVAMIFLVFLMRCLEA